MPLTKKEARAHVENLLNQCFNMLDECLIWTGPGEARNYMCDAQIAVMEAVNLVELIDTRYEPSSIELQNGIVDDRSKK